MLEVIAGSLAILMTAIVIIGGLISLDADTLDLD